MSEALANIVAAALSTAIPEGDLTVSAWAERYRYVSAQRSARPGLWRNDVVPFGRGVMDAVTEPGVTKVVFQKSSQVAGTEMLINALCYFIHRDPSLMLYIAEQEDKARSWTEEAFDPTVNESPALKACFYNSEPGRTSDNNQRVKRFRGGQLTIGWATSPAQLSSRPARVVCFDEVDAFKPTTEGDAIKLAEARTKTFQDSRKILMVSSPRDKETSIIEREYLASDRREYFVPCPHCDAFQTLKWANVKWDSGDPQSAFYVCDECGAMIEQDEKEEMLALGKWIAQAEFTGTAGFKISELYSPFTTWGDMAADFVEAKKHRETLRVFVNTRLGETWEESGDQIEYADLSGRQEVYEAEVPHGVLFLTAGVDIQDDRIECEVVGWGRDLESWSIDYRVIEGSPALQEVWDDLEDHLTGVWETADGQTFRLRSAAIDSGGHHTQQVYKFCKKNAGRKWFAIKGASTPYQPLAPKKWTLVGNSKTRLFTIGTDTAKDEIFSFLQVEEPGPGYCHFPAHYDDRYFEMLCAEKKITIWRGGRSVRKYVKVSQSARNEALDCRVYATAARAIMRPNLKAIAKRQERLAEDIEAVVTGEIKAAPVDVEIKAPKRRRQQRRIQVTGNQFGRYRAA